MIRHTKKFHGKRGGTRTRSSTLRAPTQRRMPSLDGCFREFEDKVSHLLTAYTKYRYIFDAVSEGISGGWDLSNVNLTVENWNRLLAKNNDFRKPQEDVINPKILNQPLDVTDEDGMQRVGG